MTSAKFVLFCGLLGLVHGLDDLAFPPGFKFGVASASYQAEGAWNVSDKSENVWDRFTHTHPELMSDGSNGDVACDSYHLWERDLEMIQEIGAHFYRFSISWSRLLPNGFSNIISEDGKNYYNKLIDGLLEKGIEPLITIYHWDLPQNLQDFGGWANPLIVDWFGDYARVCFSLFGDRVTRWLTLNEVLSFCDMSYNSGRLAPGINNPDMAAKCTKHALLAHAKAYRIFDEEFRPKYSGQISLANQMIWIEALLPEYEELAELARENMEGHFSHAIYSKAGGWPPALKEAYNLKAKEERFQPKLPEFTQEEIEFIRGTFDYYALNHYTSRLIRPAKDGEESTPWPLGDIQDLNAKLERHPDWESDSASAWLYVNPEGLRKTLSWLKKQYGDIPILITENGYATTEGLYDVARINYYRRYLEQVLLSIKEDGVNVTGYTAWTLMDNFEWIDGYASKFGLFEVDFTSPERKRTPRASAYFYKEVIKYHSLDI